MKNKLGKNENLTEYHSNREISYWYHTLSNDLSIEITYDEGGNELTYKNSEGDSCESTYDENGNVLTHKDSYGNSSESTYDENGNELTFKNNI